MYLNQYQQLCVGVARRPLAAVPAPIVPASLPSSARCRMGSLPPKDSVVRFANSEGVEKVLDGRPQGGGTTFQLVDCKEL